MSQPSNSRGAVASSKWQTLGVRLTSTDYGRAEAAAKQAGLSVSRWASNVLVRALRTGKRGPAAVQAAAEAGAEIEMRPLVDAEAIRGLLEEVISELDKNVRQSEEACRVTAAQWKQFDADLEEYRARLERILTENAARNAVAMVPRQYAMTQFVPKSVVDPQDLQSGLAQPGEPEVTDIIVKTKPAELICPWCKTNRSEAFARHEGPHATWCVHYRDTAEMLKEMERLTHLFLPGPIPEQRVPVNIRQRTWRDEWNHLKSLDPETARDRFEELRAGRKLPDGFKSWLAERKIEWLDKEWPL